MSPYSIPPLIVSIFTIGVGLLVLIRGKKLIYFLTTFSVFIWLLGYAIVYSTRDYEKALFFVRILYIGIVFIPAFSYHFTVTFLNLTGHKRIIKFNYLLSFIFSLLALNKFFILGLHEYYWGYQEESGSLQNLFLVYFAITMSRVIILLFKHYRQKKNEHLFLEATRIRYVLISFFVSMFASVDFLPNYGFKFYPIGFIFVAFHAAATTYAILKYHLMDIRIIITRAGVFTFVYAVVLGIPFIAGWLVYSFGSSLWFLPLLLMAILASTGPFIYMKLQKKVESRLRAEEFKSHEALRRLSHNMLRFTNLENLLKLIIHYLVKILQLKFAAIYLFDSQRNEYFLKSYWHLKQYPFQPNAELPLEISRDSSLIKNLYLRRLPIIAEKLRFSTGESYFIHIRELLATLSRLKANTIIPSFLRNTLLGFLVLGDKRTNLVFSEGDLNLLMVLSNEAALAIENARFHEKEKMVLVEKSRRDALADMAPGASHQFNNRLAAISSSAEIALLKLENINIDTLSDENVKKALTDAMESLEQITNEALKGKEITSAILKRSKAKTDFQELDIVNLIENTYRLVLITRSKPGTERFKEPRFNLTLLNEIPSIYAREALLQDCFYNLIDNAFDAIEEKYKLISQGNLKLTKELIFQGEIEIILKQEDQALIIQIKDNGIGLTKENQKRLFAPYFTTKATSDKGTGLGLYVIRDFIEMHQGLISCDSEYGEGTTFTVKLPIKGSRKNSDNK